MNSHFLFATFATTRLQALPTAPSRWRAGAGLALLKSGFTLSLGCTSALLAKNATLYNTVLREAGLGPGKQNVIKSLALSCFVLRCKPHPAKLSPALCSLVLPCAAHLPMLWA